MEASTSSMPVATSRALPAILVGGMIAGALDLTSAFIDFGWGVPRAIAGGLYYAASRKLTFLRDHALVCGLFFGIAVYHVMNQIVMPLSALHYTGPYTLTGTIKGLLAHMFLVGLPISYSVRIFSRGEPTRR